jgi:hypothetical protein
MTPNIQAVFVTELSRQTRFGLMAIRDLKIALSSDDDGDRTWYSVQALLIAVANVSKVLWPSKKYASRGAILRRLLGIGDDSVFAPRTFRNHFEHFDERLESWAASVGTSAFVDSNIGPPGMIGGIEPSGFLRNLDTRSMAITFRGDVYPLPPIADALQELHARVTALPRRQP